MDGLDKRFWTPYKIVRGLKILSTPTGQLLPNRYTRDIENPRVFRPGISIKRMR